AATQRPGPQATILPRSPSFSDPDPLCAQGTILPVTIVAELDLVAIRANARPRQAGQFARSQVGRIEGLAGILLCSAHCCPGNESKGRGVHARQISFLLILSGC